MTLPATAYEEAAGYLRLDQNTNPRRNPAVEDVELSELSLHEYPSPDSSVLREALADRHGLDPGQVVVANGADQVLGIALAAAGGPGLTAAYLVPSFHMYAYYSRLLHFKPVEVPLGPGFSLPAEEIVRTGAAVTLIASPNNPTGNAFPAQEIEGLLQGIDGMLVLDAAYAEYAGRDYTGLLRDHGNLVIAGTFSKAYGLAGLRVGYALASRAMAEPLRRCRPPYALGQVAEAVALAALRREDFVKESVELARQERVRLTAGLRSLGFDAFPSEANFLLVRPPCDALELHSNLKARRILVRAFPQRTGLMEYLRVSVGLPCDTDHLLSELKVILEGMG
jgi:histidinol-phosphate aminotransferase